ncbi:D-glycerate 2-kinase [Fundidesulfovibrio magnetotacticus]|uniref:D-glycerate 2-kinase n=1 Tax=Fundidesulfovibrio magnetotacticus TaxID=2730080 RepID=A0A6V8M2G0_9BACT|nr:glycerate kinase [Fundidesulfovibrio magnetotacticus]GFK96106.1 D-glycerate 2-kinase [Fundidesulfovibrio magnetotacticus]
MPRPFEHLTQMFQAALDRVDPYKMIVNHVRLEGSRLLVSFEDERHEVDLDRFERVLVLGAGKASARMGKALEDILGDRIHSGLLSVKYGHAEPLKHIEVVESGHPTPDEQGVGAAQRIADLVRAADAKTLVLNLVSGGGSALLPCPISLDLPEGPLRLTLEDKQNMTRALLACGADIGEINCIRKHISAVKGGRLLKLMAPARSLNFILSDVVGDRLDTIASGLTSHDETTFEEAMAIIEKYQLQDKAPANVLRTLELGVQGRIEETTKPGDPATELASNILIGSNQAALTAACETARSLGYNTAALTCALTGESREAAKFLWGIAKDVRKTELLVKKPACIIAGGETVVTLKGEGKGGRNQEMALAFLAELARDELKGADIFFLSASTDGTDGPTDAAGAFASAELVEMAHAAGLSINASLRDNDSYHFFERIGRLLKTGPTMTNVCDLHMVIVSP